MEKCMERSVERHCPVCHGNWRCPQCHRGLEHFPGYVYRLSLHLVDTDIPKGEFARLGRFLDERELWEQLGHYTSCDECETLSLLLSDHLILHWRLQGKNTLQIWDSQTRSGYTHVLPADPLFSAEWHGSPVDPEVGD